jgi:CVNH domain-containing protein
MNMRYITLLAVGALAILWRPATSGAAAVDNPPGSYQQSCKNISVRGDDLRARCKDNYGNYHDTVLDHADRCWGDISNDNGNLVCNNGQGWGGPNGSFTQTCRDVSVRWNVLRARCQTADGRWVDSSLDQYSRCKGDISNENGQLRCAYAGRGWGRDNDRDDRGRGYGPRGSYSQTCRDIRTRGNNLSAVCQNVDGQWVGSTLNNFDRCASEIVNDDGRLECTRRGGRLVPAGTYSETCRNVYVRGDTLRAECQNRGGGWNWSQLNDWDDCRRGIENDDGRLRCNR